MDIQVRISPRIRLASVLVLLMVAMAHSLIADKTKPALKALEKKEYGKVEELLLKALEKDTLSPGSFYVYSLLYVTDSFPRYNIDTAHTHILKAEKNFILSSEKEKESLAKDNITQETLRKQHAYVDSLAFGRASRLNTLEALEHFTKHYPMAEQHSVGVAMLNTVAFDIAESKDTWQAYQDFFEKYPKATQADKAKKRYYRLIFEEKTKSGTLSDLEAFLTDQPNSPFRAIVEEKIFRIMGAYGETSRLLAFIQKTTNRQLQRQAMDLIYYLNPTLPAFQTMLESSRWKSYSDSLKTQQALQATALVPFLKDNKYGFTDLNGELVIDSKFDKIAPAYYCGNITSHILDVSIGKKHLLINRSMDTVYAKPFENVTKLNGGMLKLFHQNKAGLLHQTGITILSTRYQDISTLSEGLFLVKSNGKFGIIGFLGKELLPTKYDDIYLDNDYLIIENGDRIAITRLGAFIAQSKQGKPVIKFRYDDYEIIDQHLICFDGNKETLLDSLLNEVVPLDEHRINTKFDTWVIKEKEGYRLFDRESREFKEEMYDKVVQNQQWMAVKQSDKWSVYSKTLSDVPIVGLDSVNLLGEDIALVFRGEDGMAIFPNKKIVEFSKEDKLYSIGSGKKANVHYLVIRKNGKNILYRDGERVIESVYEIGYISDNVFSAKARGEYGAMDDRARLIMRVRYDAIGEAENGIAPVLYNGRFGAYNFRDNILISLKFDEKLKPYNSDLLITKSRGKKGIYNVRNENIVDNEYEEIVYWSDSVALMKSETEWALRHIYTGEVLFGGMTDFEFLSDKAGEQIVKFRAESGMGIYTAQQGVLFDPTFNDIINIGSEDHPYYFCEKSIREAGYYVAVYMDQTGKTVRSQAYREEEYDNIFCER